jgi:hypothetical protein
MSKSTKIFKNQDKIDDWAKKKSKIKGIDEFKILKKYLIFNSFEEEELKLSSDYVFYYYFNDLDKIKKLGLRPENVFKLSILQIFNKFKEYFQDHIDFEILFEKPNELEAFNEGKNIKNCARPDIQINMSRINSEDKKLFILEYNEKGSHETVYDSYKDTKAIQNSYMFYKYEEKNEHIEELNFSNTIKNIILDMFCVICTILNNKFILSKIIYFQNYSHLEKQILDNKTKKFNYIQEISNSTNFDLKKLYLELLPHDSEGELYSYSQFIKLLIDEYDIELGSDKKQTIFDSKYFSIIIICLDSNISDDILEYKKIYSEAVCALDKASEKIIYFTNKQFDKTHNQKKYLENYLEYDLEKSNNIRLLKKISTNLKNKLKKYLDDI